MPDSTVVKTIAARPPRAAVAPREERINRAILLMLFALLTFCGIDTCAKWLIQGGLPPMEVVFVRYALHAVLAVALALPAMGRSLFQSANPSAEAWRALFLLGSTIFNFSAVQYLPLTLTGTIFFTIPLWVCALSVPMLGEQVGWRRWTAILSGFVGVVIAMRPWAAELHWAVILSFCAALCAAMYGIMTRRLAGVDTTATQQVYAALLASICIAPFALTDWVWPDTALEWLAFSLVGLFGWGGHQAMTIAHRYAPASTLAPFTYVQLIFMSASSWLIFHQPPTVWLLVGASVVVASGLYIWLRERRIMQS